VHLKSQPWGDRDRRILGVPQLATQPKPVSTRFSERPCLKRQDGKRLDIDLWPLHTGALTSAYTHAQFPLAYTIAHIRIIYMHCAHRHTHTHSWSLSLHAQTHTYMHTPSACTHTHTHTHTHTQTPEAYPYMHKHIPTCTLPVHVHTHTHTHTHTPEACPSKSLQMSSCTSAANKSPASWASTSWMRHSLQACHDSELLMFAFDEKIHKWV
jgi:hypothetical protein